MVLSSSLATWPTSANLEPTSVFSCETNLSNSEHVTNLPVFRIPDILMRIRTNGSGFGSGSCSFLSDLQDDNKKFFCFLL
jgi:hypothetical protein